MRFLGKFLFVSLFILISAYSATGSNTPGATTVPFMENTGQVNPDVAYFARSAGGTVFITRTGEIVLALGSSGSDGTQVLRERSAVLPVGQPEGFTVSQTNVSVFIGNEPEKWRPRVRAWREVAMGEICPGTELRIKAEATGIEKIFVISPGAIPPLSG